jgi:hypothetical protein
MSFKWTKRGYLIRRVKCLSTSKVGLNSHIPHATTHCTGSGCSKNLVGPPMGLFSSLCMLVIRMRLGFGCSQCPVVDATVLMHSILLQFDWMDSSAKVASISWAAKFFFSRSTQKSPYTRANYLADACMWLLVYHNTWCVHVLKARSMRLVQDRYIYNSASLEKKQKPRDNNGYSKRIWPRSKSSTYIVRAACHI